MKILIDIGHPAHVHLLKNLYFELIKKNHFVLVTVKDMKSAKDLLDLYNIPYIELGKKKDSIFQKFILQLKYNWKVYRIVTKNKIEFGIGSSPILAQISSITKMKSIFLDDDDDDVQPFTVKFAHPFADIVLSPDVLKGKRKKKECIYYPGYHELAYLHPNNFKPELNVIKELGISDKDRYFILRFNAFKAHHDIGVKGLNLEQKLKLVKVLEKHGKIFITTEGEINPELKKYQLKVSPEKAHSLLNYATMFIGDSQTMASEAAVLGIPSIRCNTLVGKISYLEEEEHKYSLTFGFQPDEFERMLEKIETLLDNKQLKEVWQDRRQNMLKDKIDVTEFFKWFVENYSSNPLKLNEIPYNNFK